MRFASATHRITEVKPDSLPLNLRLRKRRGHRAPCPAHPRAVVLRRSSHGTSLARMFPGYPIARPLSQVAEGRPAPNRAVLPIAPLVPPAAVRVRAVRFLDGFGYMSSRFVPTYRPLSRFARAPCVRGCPGAAALLRPEPVWTVWIWISSRFSTPSTPPCGALP